METVAESSNQAVERIPSFALWDGGADHKREERAGLASLSIHAAVVIALALMPRSIMQHAQRIAHNITPLIAPPAELTQPTPNKGKIAKEINSEALLARPRVQIPPSPPSTTRPSARVLALPSPQPGGPSPVIPEPPSLTPAEKEAAQMAQQMPAPQIQTVEKPKLTLENVAPPSPTGQGFGRTQSPGSAISEAARSVARGGGGGLVVGDPGEGIGGIGEGLNLPPSPGRQASNLELLSDPMGVDFRPYLIQILSMVRRNWFAVMPESAKLGRRGKVSIQFAVDRLGRVPKLVIVGPSGTDALDRAAVAGISASNPFPPLPPEFRGQQVRLQFNFLYNMTSR